ncbi:MAG TPA: hypothetical protein VNB24_04740 [Acidimicrobiales bacterium]|nr:hypothetical protein [Acidimicrobiales bacterium]
MRKIFLTLRLVAVAAGLAAILIKVFGAQAPGIGIPIGPRPVGPVGDDR